HHVAAQHDDLGRGCRARDRQRPAVLRVLMPDVEQTKELAYRIRRHVVRMTSLGGSSHVGSVLSMADIVAVLYGSVLRVDPERPRWPDRDRLILSKGHAGAGIYAALAERGFFQIDEL